MQLLFNIFPHGRGLLHLMALGKLEAMEEEAMEKDKEKKKQDAKSNRIQASESLGANANDINYDYDVDPNEKVEKRSKVTNLDWSNMSI